MSRISELAAPLELRALIRQTNSRADMGRASESRSDSGSATDIKVLSSDDKAKAMRMFEVTFSALSPGGQEAPRHAIVSALQPEGSTDVVMLVGSSTSGS